MSRNESLIIRLPWDPSKRRGLRAWQERTKEKIQYVLVPFESFDVTVKEAACENYLLNLLFNNGRIRLIEDLCFAAHIYCDAFPRVQFDLAIALVRRYCTDEPEIFEERVCTPPIHGVNASDLDRLVPAK